MTEEPKPKETAEPKPDEKKKSDVEQLRDEFTAQFATLKNSFETELTALKTENSALKADNDELKRALVRSAINPAPVKTEVEKTPEELYKEKVDACAKRTLELMSSI